MAEIKICSEVTGTAWKILVTEGDELIIAEAMKMEIPHVAPGSGMIKKVCVEEGASISEDDLLFIIET